MPSILAKLPAPVATWLRTRFGKHLSRFAVVALASLVTTQVTLSIAYLIIGTGGLATFFGWIAGAAVSYSLSRRAWERTGKPHMLKETVPFWAISACTGIVLITAGHLASEFAKDHHLTKLAATAAVSGTVLLANLLTFLTRFLIFHFLLFADRGRDRAETADEAEWLSPAAIASRAPAHRGPAPTHPAAATPRGGAGSPAREGMHAPARHD